MIELTGDLFNDYRKFVGLMATAPEGWRQPDLALAGLGIGGEGGEVEDIIKKHLYHNKPLDAEHLLEELGDLLWYIQLALNTSPIKGGLDNVILLNMVKLAKRYPERLEKQAV